MAGAFETALLKANVYPVKGREVFWLIAKGQLEHIVTEISLTKVPFAQNYLAGITVWQGLVVPVISLERFYRFKVRKPTPISKRVLVKTALQNTGQTAARLLVDIPYDLKIRSIESDCTPAAISPENLEAKGLVGVYEWEDDKLLLVPDLTRIAAGEVSD